eukprot:481755-Pleurochrysis_carterae.AAC.1
MLVGVSGVGGGRVDVGKMVDAEAVGLVVHRGRGRHLFKSPSEICENIARPFSSSSADSV